MKMDKTVFQVVDLHDTQTDKVYWFSLTPEKRIEALELMRLMAYGPDAVNARLQRVFEVVVRK